MKKVSRGKAKNKQPDELLPEYQFDYQKSKPNRFAKRMRPDSIAIMLDPDVAKVFDSGKAVNAVLRALMKTMPTGRDSSRQ